jgi:hypothetical protein
MKQFLILFLFLNVTTVLGQDGHLSLKHFSVPLPKQDYLFNDMDMDAQGRLLLAYRRGLLQFDGRQWEKISITSSPLRFLHIDSNLFVLTRDGISLIKQNNFNQNKVVNLYSNNEFLIGADLIKFKDNLYYLAGNKILRFKGMDFQVDTTFESKLGFNDIFKYKGKLFAFEGNFLLEFYKDSWIDINLYAPEDADFVFSCQTDSLVFFAYDNGDFFAFNGKEFKVFSKELNQYLKDNYPVSGKILGDMIVIATLNGGAVLVDINTGKIQNSIQYYNGLPSDQVSAITMDDQNGIWLAHSGGISRASLEVPIKEFHHYPGLKGIPETVLYRNDTLFVGTNDGLFYLAEVKDYETLQKVMEEKVKVETYVEEEPREGDEQDNKFFSELFSTSLNSEEQFIEEKLEVYKKIFRSEGYRFRKLKERLAEKESFLRDSMAEVNQKAKIKNNPDKKPPSVRKEVSYKTVKKLVNISKLKSVKFQYLQVDNINRKVNTLIDTPKGIIAITTSGVFLVKNLEAIKLSNQRFIEKALYDNTHGKLWLTGDFGLYSLNLSDEAYKTQFHFSAPIYDIAIIENEIALAGENEVYTFKIENDKLAHLKTYTIKNDFSDKILIFYNKRDLKILKLDGLYKIAGDSIVAESNFDENLKFFLKDTRNSIWLNNQMDQWSLLNRTGQYTDLRWMRIFPHVKFINPISDSLIYFVVDNRILELKGKEEFAQFSSLSFINSVYKHNQKLTEFQDTELQHNNNSLRINLSTIDYLFPEGVSYQYYVKGLTDEWSQWSKVGEIDFPYIPTGDYTIEIRARSGFSGEITNFDFTFEVLPPYWRTWWFYLLEITFFSTLILISLKLNRSSRNTYLTNTVTFLTLILILEFFATVLENNLEGLVEDSPVYSFIINIILAFSITPMERGVNKLLLITNTRNLKRITHRMRMKQEENKKNEQNKD